MHGLQPARTWGVGYCNAAMPLAGFDHYNLRAARPVLNELRDLYRDVVGLTVGQRPPFSRFGYFGCTQASGPCCT